MPALNPKHELYAQRIAQGEIASEAYRTVFGYTGKHANSQSARLSALVSNRVNEILAKVEAQTLLTIEEKRRLYARVVRCSVNNLPLDSDLIQSVKKVKRKVGGETEEVIEIRVLDKLKATELDSKLAGDLVDKIEHIGGIEQSEAIYVDLPPIMLKPPAGLEKSNTPPR